MTPHQEWFTTFKSCNLEFVYLSDDKTCTITEMGQIKIPMVDCGVGTLNDVKYISELRKRLISSYTLHANDFSKVNKGALTVMRPIRIAGNIYKVLANIVVGDVASVDSNNDTTTL